MSVFSLDDTLVSNMDNKDKKYVAQAIKLTNLENVLSIQDEAITLNNIDHSMFSLHINIEAQTDLTSFWETFDRLKYKNRNIMTMGDILRKIIDI